LITVSTVSQKNVFYEYPQKKFPEAWIPGCFILQIEWICLNMDTLFFGSWAQTWLCCHLCEWFMPDMVTLGLLLPLISSYFPISVFFMSYFHSIVSHVPLEPPQIIFEAKWSRNK
jgi:hypothetical protein